MIADTSSERSWGMLSRTIARVPSGDDADLNSVLSALASLPLSVVTFVLCWPLYWGQLTKKRLNLKLLIAATALASLIVISDAQDPNSEQEQLNARVEQDFSEISNGRLRAEKTGNVVRLIRLQGRAWQGYYAQLNAKFFALHVLIMDSTAQTEKSESQTRHFH